MNDFCECKEDGYCHRYKREFRGRLRQICQGINVDAGEAENYRRLWLSQAEGKPAQQQTQQTQTSLPVVSVADCPHRGEPIKDASGENRKATCAPCGGKQRQVFQCNHPALAPHETTLPGCSTCEYRPRATDARALILKNHLSPGDVLVMTAAIHSLHRAHPGKFLTAVDTTANA